MKWAILTRVRLPRLLIYPAIFFVLLLAAQLAGFRDHLQVLSGTSAYVPWSMFQGATYLLLYFITVVASPIMLIAAALQALARLAFHRFSATAGDR